LKTLSQIASASELRVLHLYVETLTEQDLRALRGTTQLEALYLSRGFVLDADSLRHLEKMTHLKKMILFESGPIDSLEAARGLAKKLPNTQVSCCGFPLGQDGARP